MKLLAILSVWMFGQVSILGQAVSPQPAFEVASVKALGEPAQGGTAARSTGLAPPVAGDATRIDFYDVTLLGVLCRAYNLKPLQIVAPEWLKTERYAIAAKVPAGAPKGQVPAMLQNLLAERFKMRVRWETKEAQGYALVAGKGGPKLKSAVSEIETFSRPPLSFTSSGHFVWNAITLGGFADSLTVSMAAPVVDMTNLQGTYDIVLDVAPDSLPGFSFGAATTGSSNPSIFTAVRGLGLNLEARKVSVKKLVVDSAQKKPTEN